jgi:hypothetical protein
MLSQTHKMPLNRENTDATVLAKTMAVRPTSHTGQRSALGDIGNKVKAISIDTTKKPAAIKKEIIQPADKSKVLNKNKGTTSLKSLVENVVSKLSSCEDRYQVHFIIMKVCLFISN